MWDEDYMDSVISGMMATLISRKTQKSHFRISQVIIEIEYAFISCDFALAVRTTRLLVMCTNQ